jgi:hypothetical protein
VPKIESNRLGSQFGFEKWIERAIPRGKNVRVLSVNWGQLTAIYLKNRHRKYLFLLYLIAMSCGQLRRYLDFKSSAQVKLPVSGYNSRML